MNLDELEQATIAWGEARGIVQNGTVQAQLLKTLEELGELAADIARGRCINDSLGDVLVTLAMVARMSGTTLTAGWSHAYAEIKDRTGYLSPEGIFIKDEAELMLESAESILGKDVEFR